MGATGTSETRGVVLVVDDQELVRNSLVRLLEVHGVRAEGFAEGGAALERLESGDVRLMIVDVVLDDMPGPEVVRRARQRQPALPVVAMSGYREPPASLTGLARPDAWLPKPFDASTLVALVEELCARPRSSGPRSSAQPIGDERPKSAGEAPDKSGA